MVFENLTACEEPRNRTAAASPFNRREFRSGRVALLLTALVILLTSVATVSASDHAVFGPEEFTIVRLRTHVFLRRFKVSEPGEGSILITRNSPVRMFRSGSVTLNGRRISLRQLFHGTRTVLERKIRLRRRNHLQVSLQGARGASITIEVREKSLTPPNRPPEAEAQSVTTAEETAISITLTGTDADGDSLTYQVISEPGHGTLAGTPPNLTYTPNADYTGTDSFTFTVNDGTVDSAPATVSLTVNPVNDPPVAGAGPDQTVSGGDTVSLDGSGSVDVDGDPLSYPGPL
jgi:hypothetical protein